MSFLRVFGIALLPVFALVAADPIPQFGSNPLEPLECLVVTNVISAIEQQGQATPFCSSYLSIQTQTVTTTTTTTLPTVTSTFVTTDATATITPQPVTVSTSTTATVSSCRPAAATAGSNRKRDASPQGLFGGLLGFPASQISQACSCLDIPTPTQTNTATATISPSTTLTQFATATTTLAPSTVTTTSTSYTTVTNAAACPTPAQCGNNGIAYAAFNNVEGRNNDNTYSTFQVAFMKSPQGSQNILYTGQTTVPGGINNNCGNSVIQIYGSNRGIPCSYYALDHRFYFFAPVTGTYTFSIFDIDDIALLWSGRTAQGGWTRTNASIEANIRGDGGPLGVASYTINLNSGQYLPLRIVYANAQRGTEFDFSITDPFGTLIVDSSETRASSPYLVTQGCPGEGAESAPPFAGAFGSEM